RLSSHTLFLFPSTATTTTEIYTLSLHDALPISFQTVPTVQFSTSTPEVQTQQIPKIETLEQTQNFESDIELDKIIANLIRQQERSEEHTSELQSRFDIVCRLLLEKKKTHQAKRA